MAVGQVQAGIAARGDIGHGLHGRRGRGQHHRTTAQLPTHHRHVAGMIGDAVILFEAGIVFFIDDQQSQLLIRKEQGRAGADHHLGRACRHRPPGIAALGIGQFGMPLRRLDAETAAEALQPLRRQGDFRQQHQGLPPGGQAGGDGLEINLGLARAGDAVNDGNGKAARHRLTQMIRRRLLTRRQAGTGMIGIGAGEGRWRRHGHRLQGAGLQQSLDHGGADPGLARQIGGQQGRQIARHPQHPPPRLGQLDLGQHHCRPAGDQIAHRFQRLGHAHGHAQHRARRRDGIAGHPIDEFTADRRQGRAGQPPDHRLQLGFGDTAGGLAPHHANHFAPAQRHGDEIPRLQAFHPGQIIVQSGQGQGQQHRHARMRRKLTAGVGGDGNHGLNLAAKSQEAITLLPN